MASVSVPAERPGGLLRRPHATTGWWSWFTTVDHKKIGILYGITAFGFFLIGGSEALLIRVQLARPDQTFLEPAVYNELFTMHGITMVFLVVMPLSAAFFNYLMPLMIGARDVAFPRLNAFSYWAFLFAGLFIYSSWFLGGAPNGGWFGYAPNSVTDPSIGMTFYAIGLLIAGIASTVSAVNLAVTVLNMRAPGMTLFRMPVFVWMGLVVQLLLAFSLPVITIGLVELLFDRLFGTHFFDVAAGGSPVLWQHLFWLFGHPEVYILILPAMGIVSEILPVFARKPLFGYQFVVFSGIAIGFIGFGVWAHHMFAVGLGPVANTAFAVSTMIIAIPTGVKIFNWLGTMWSGDLRFATPMLFSIGFIAMFVIGGLSGVTHAVVPSDYQQTDTYYIVAHFHYVLFGGAIFGLFAGIYYWWPKVFGRMLSRELGQGELLADADRLQHDLRADAHPGPAGHAAAHPELPGVAGAVLLEPGLVDRRVRDRDQRPGVPDQRGRELPQAQADGGGPMGRPDARVGDLLAAARVQLRGDPGRALPRRPVAPQVRGDRGRTRRPGGGRRFGGGRRRARRASGGPWRRPRCRGTEEVTRSTCRRPPTSR